VWKKNEVEALLGDDSDLFCRYYHITESGNWEDTNILHVTLPPDDFARTYNIDVEELRRVLLRSREKLLHERAKRVRPQTDDKIILGWNAMMNAAYSRAFMATGLEKYRILAVRNMDFLLEKFISADGSYHHTYKNGAKYPAFIDDYSQLIHALILLQEITSDATHLQKVKTLVKWCIDHFGDIETDYFYYTIDGQQDVVVRKKELYDGAVPSGNSLMAWNLYYAGIIFDNAGWRQKAVSMCGGLKDVVLKYPTSFGVWALVMQAISKGIPEIAVVGGNLDTVLRDILRFFIPFRILQSSPSETKDFPLLAGKPSTSSPMIYLCKDYSCQTPVNEVFDFKKLLAGMFNE